MYSLKIDVINQNASGANEFQAAAQQFVEALEQASGLEVKAPRQRVDATRGDIPLLTDIIAYGASIGAFSAIYLLAKDLYDRYFNAEVKLTFPDGSTLNLKHLSTQEAEQKMKAHLDQQASPTLIIQSR